MKGFYSKFCPIEKSFLCNMQGYLSQYNHIYFIKRQEAFLVPLQPCGDGVTGGYKPQRRPALVDLTLFTLFIAFRPPSITFLQVFFQFVTNFHTVKAIFFFLSSKPLLFPAPLLLSKAAIGRLYSARLHFLLWRENKRLHPLTCPSLNICN